MTMHVQKSGDNLQEDDLFPARLGEGGWISGGQACAANASTCCVIPLTPHYFPVRPLCSPGVLPLGTQERKALIRACGQRALV